MLRYLKVKGQWIDTLSELRDNRNTYLVIDNRVICITANDEEYFVGNLEEESDEMQFRGM